MPDIETATNCKVYDVTPVTVFDLLDGTFDVYSNVCKKVIFESQSKVGTPDSYEWDGDRLVVRETELDMVNVTFFDPEHDDQDCSAYDKIDDPIIGILKS